MPKKPSTSTLGLSAGSTISWMSGVTAKTAIFMDKLSGTKTKLRGLTKCLETARILTECIHACHTINVDRFALAAKR